MIIEFHDQKGQRLHDKFQDWRRENQDAYFLTFSGKNNAYLFHKADACWHIGPTDCVWDDKHSLTKNRKVCANSLNELLSWAAKKGVAVKYCSNCFKEPPVITPATTPADLKETTSNQNYNIATTDAALAVEGVSRETIVITKSRSGALRKTALENARGVCEACKVDYSHILDGLGQHVLQVHHKKQLALANAPQVNDIEDLAVVCANCHQMIHADIANAMSVEELRMRLCKQT